MKNKYINPAYTAGQKIGKVIGSLIGLCIGSLLFGLWAMWVLKSFDFAGITYLKTVGAMFILMAALVYSSLPKFVKTIPFWSLTLATAYIMIFK